MSRETGVSGYLLNSLLELNFVWIPPLDLAQEDLQGVTTLFGMLRSWLWVDMSTLMQLLVFG